MNCDTVDADVVLVVRTVGVILGSGQQERVKEGRFIDSNKEREEG